MLRREIVVRITFFLTFFLRVVDQGGGRTQSIPRFSLFFHFQNVAVAHMPLNIFTELCCGPQETPIFAFSIFAIFTECACSPRGVKNSMLTKKHRNCECA